MAQCSTVTGESQYQRKVIFLFYICHKGCLWFCCQFGGGGGGGGREYSPDDMWVLSHYKLQMSCKQSWRRKWLGWCSSPANSTAAWGDEAHASRTWSTSAAPWRKWTAWHNGRPQPVWTRWARAVWAWQSALPPHPWITTTTSGAVS